MSETNENKNIESVRDSLKNANESLKVDFDKKQKEIDFANPDDDDLRALEEGVTQ